MFVCFGFFVLQVDHLNMHSKFIFTTIVIKGLGRWFNILRPLALGARRPKFQCKSSASKKKKKQGAAACAYNPNTGKKTQGDPTKSVPARLA